MKVRIIGDVHGKQGQYVRLAQEAELSLQLGDVGFDYSFIHQHLDVTRNRLLLGNHDNYYARPAHDLGDFGPDPMGIPESFWVRGAFSIDQAYRTIGISWWEEEELTVQEGEACIDAYLQTRPRRMFTHDASFFLVPHVTSMPGLKLPASRTQLLLNTLWNLHQPEEWTFGHYHKSVTVQVEGCRFQCLNELEYVDREY
jgi:hypothetical protein